jgi:hypothetical protein
VEDVANLLENHHHNYETFSRRFMLSLRALVSALRVDFDAVPFELLRDCTVAELLAAPRGLGGPGRKFEKIPEPSRDADFLLKCGRNWARLLRVIYGPAVGDAFATLVASLDSRDLYRPEDIRRVMVDGLLEISRAAKAGVSVVRKVLALTQDQLGAHTPSNCRRFDSVAGLPHPVTGKSRVVPVEARLWARGTRQRARSS